MLLSLGNTKIQKNRINTASFGLEAGKTCPYKGDCQHECFAMVGNYVYQSVKNKQKERLKESKKKSFVDKICEEIKLLNVGAVRIHDSGDYYSRDYLNKWIEIAKRNPDIVFYSYTKSIPFFKKDYNTWSITLPKNFIVTFSYGGKHDDLINPKKDKHALVFESLESLLAYKYSDTSSYDDNAYNSKVLRVGLVAKKNRKKVKWGETFEKMMG
jgi:hypothetical protein